MVQPLINFSLDTPEAFLDFIKKLRGAGVLKFADGSTCLDLTPGNHEEIANIDLDSEWKKQRVRDAFKTAQELEEEARIEENWSV